MWCVVVENGRKRERIEWMRHPPRPERDGFQLSFSNGRPFFFSFFLLPPSSSLSPYILLIEWSFPPPFLHSQLLLLLLHPPLLPPFLLKGLPAMLGNILPSSLSLSLHLLFFFRLLLLAIFLSLFGSSGSPLPASGIASRRGRRG